MAKYDFGYPRECSLCKSFSTCSHELRVEPYLKEGGQSRLMLIGQDPTIRKDSNRVKEVFMLDDKNSQLTKWLKNIIGSKAYQEMTIYATNVVKCSFGTVPTDTDQGGKRFLRPFFNNCKSYLIDEINGYQPTIIITFGEPAHKLFISILENCDMLDTMNKAFTGKLVVAKLHDFRFYYSPCLHIQTWRVAETYGARVREFKANLTRLLDSEGR